MAGSRVDGIEIAGIVSCIPERSEGLADLAARFGGDFARRVGAATGIEQRPMAPYDVCTSDLAFAAAQRLLTRLDWSPESIDLCILVTQTGDQPLPATAALLHRRLGLTKACAAFDLGLGCSGYVYGLWTAAALLRSMPGGRRGLLLAGDTTVRLCDPQDRSVAPLFGDAATATALVTGTPTEVETDADVPWVVRFGTDGAGAPYLAVEAGGLRRPDAAARLSMDGTQVFAFTLREVPDNIRATLRDVGWSVEDADYFVLHQANAQMLRHLGSKLGARPDQVPIALARFGNTSSASVPLALTEALAQPLMTGRRRLVLSGFGVGWSWATAALAAGPLRVCETMVLPGSA